MRVLLVTNPMPISGCGVASFSHQQAAALKQAGLDVTMWETWPPVYLPPDAHTYDVVHINWHPLVTGHILPQHLPVGPLISAHLHEYVPDWERHRPPIFEAITVKFSSEPIPWDPSVVFWQIPVPEVTPRFNKGLTPGVVYVGHTGLRGDGLDRLRPACEKNGWLITATLPGVWYDLQTEVDRLSSCDVVVVQNHGGYSGQSSAVMTAIASRRPVVVNSGRMLEQIRRINREEYANTQLYVIEDAEEGVREVLYQMALGAEKRPVQLAEDYKWSNRIGLVVREWEKHR